MSSSGFNLEKYRIPLTEINRATENFSSETLVGDGGFGMVYRGQLSKDWRHRLVAIKRLDHNGYQGNKEFLNELNLVASFDHSNIIRFVGYCDDENEKIIVCAYATNGSLDYHLQNPNLRWHLTWEQRLKICLGAARGIEYLHSGRMSSEVIHRDMKSANILLDDNMDAKICDFGLSRLDSTNEPDTGVFTKVAGTRFYMDPIYNERSRLTKESDIYSFGVVMFEMSSGMMAYIPSRIEDSKGRYLIDLVRSYYDDHKFVDKLIDPAMKGQIDMSSFDKFNKIAHECISLDISKRPRMDKLITTIEEALNIQADSVWESLLPPGYREVIARAFSQLVFSSKKQLYLSLSNSHILLDRGYLSFQIDKISGKKCYMLGAKVLSIEWQDDKRYWKWEHIPESRFAEVCTVIEVTWLAIHGTISAEMLSRNCTYVAYLVFRTTGESKGLDVPAEAKVTFCGTKMVTENVYLQRPEAPGGTQHVPYQQEKNVFPRRRNDGWMEIELGEFKCIEGADGEVEMAFDEHKSYKKGLIVEGIELRPK
ncbi:unnamed protein product [Lactuca saligna]|uniref:non-specific serine/threonine protein kinase n=1 Tax=Lactuca saligna TaxID=75948 RepID=A0AA36A0A3_LACSI|nr:unnamed protein product [Lactuca saligna]